MVRLLRDARSISTGFYHIALPAPPEAGRLASDRCRRRVVCIICKTPYSDIHFRVLCNSGLACIKRFDEEETSREFVRNVTDVAGLIGNAVSVNTAALVRTIPNLRPVPTSPGAKLAAQPRKITRATVFDIVGALPSLQERPLP